MICNVFASRSITAHLLRGVVAALLLPWAIANASSQPAMALVSAAAAVVAMRGCPMCWTVGLIDTIAARLKRGV
jgi:hypothetical protein